MGTNMTYYAELMEKTGRAYAIENCHWGHCGTDAWYHNPDGSSCPTEKWCPFNWFRTSGDINSKTDSWFSNLQTTTKFLDKDHPLSVPSCWAYPDMMEVGRISGGTVAWSRAHFGAWCVVSAPLILGLNLTDNKTLRTIVPFITNKEAIAVNQNWAGHPGQLVAQLKSNTSGLPIQVWMKPQPQKKIAVYVVNPSPADVDVEGAPSDPLSCFAKVVFHMCFGQYKMQYPAITSPSGCATQCLVDTSCTAFVWAVPSEGTQCRLSHTCTSPSSFLGGFDGYFRNSSQPGCGAQPKPPAAPANVTVDFSTLGFSAAVTRASVRDLWARKEIGDATDAKLQVTVPPMDSAFLILTPKVEAGVVV